MLKKSLKNSKLLGLILPLKSYIPIFVKIDLIKREINSILEFRIFIIQNELPRHYFFKIKMQNLFKIKKIEISLLLLTLLLLSINTISFAQNIDSWIEEPVTVRFQNKPLGKVLGIISQQTGIAIFFDQELSDEKVTCDYKNVKVSDAINRLFSDKNKSIQLNKEQKSIFIKTFGAKNFIRAETHHQQFNSLKMKPADIKKMHAKQYKEYKERIADEQEVLEGGKIRAEIKEMHRQHEQAYRAGVTNGKMILENGKSRNDVRKEHSEQYQDYLDLISDDNRVLEGGSTRGQIRKEHQKQVSEYKAFLNKDTELEGGLTRSQVRKMHKEQEVAFKEIVEE